MEIECPPHAVALWLQGDTLMVRFPDRQLVEIPAAEWGRLLSVLRWRETAARKGETLGIGTRAAPLQYVLDQRPRRTREELDARAVRKRESKHMDRREAEALLALVGM